MMSALAAAIELAAEGFATFPCQANKHPFPGSHGFKDATADVDELRALWRRYPGPLVGVATGPASDIAVLDIDKKHPEAHTWWAAHRAQLQPTRVHRTRSGGLHLLYTDPGGGLKCSASKIAKGIDVRGDGGYIIWWPAAGLPVLSGAHAPAPWPEWLTRLLEPHPVALPVPRRPSLSNSPGARRARLEGLVKAVLTAPEGNRNACLFWAARTVHDIAGELEVAEHSEAVEALFLAGRSIGLPDMEIRRTLKSAERRVA